MNAKHIQFPVMMDKATRAELEKLVEHYVKMGVVKSGIGRGKLIRHLIHEEYRRMMQAQ